MTINNYSIRLPPIDKSKEYSFKKLKKNIKNLPDELKRYIFDFLKYELWLNEFIDTINSVNCKSLEYNILRPILPYICAFPTLTKLCIEKINDFQEIFIFQKVNGNKSFLNFNKGDDFALTLLCCFYK
jgi:hypothetical protein